MENNERFNPFTENWNKWPEPTVKFFFSQAEAKLKQLIEAGRRITDRANTLIITTTTLLVLMLGYILKCIIDGGELKLLLFLAAFNSIALFVVIFLLIKLMFPRNVMPIGRDPKELINESFLNEEYRDEDITIAVILTECQSYQECIEFNQRDNDRRLNLLKIALYILVSILPISIVIASLYLWWLA